MVRHEQYYWRQAIQNTLKRRWPEDIPCSPCHFSRVFADIYMEYGKIVKMTITQGKVHKYLDMTIDYYSPGGYYSWWLNVLEILLVILQDKWRGDHPHLLYTNSSILQKIQPRCPIPTQIFFAIFSTANTSFKEGTSRNPYTSIIPLH